MASCCGDAAAAAEQIIKAKMSYSYYNQPVGFESMAIAEDNNMVRMEFTGQSAGSIKFSSVQGKRLTQVYRGGNNATHKYITAPEGDAALLETTGKWKRVHRAPQVAADLASVAETPIEVLPLPAAPAEIDIEDVYEWAEVDATSGAIEAMIEKGWGPSEAAHIKGSGKDDRITVKDVKDHIPL